MFNIEFVIESYKTYKEKIGKLFGINIIRLIEYITWKEDKEISLCVIKKIE